MPFWRMVLCLLLGGLTLDALKEGGLLGAFVHLAVHHTSCVSALVRVLGGGGGLPLAPPVLVPLPL